MNTIRLSLSSWEKFVKYTKEERSKDLADSTLPVRVTMTYTDDKLFTMYGLKCVNESWLYEIQDEKKYLEFVIRFGQ